jgi:hypothetical protein
MRNYRPATFRGGAVERAITSVKLGIVHPCRILTVAAVKGQAGTWNAAGADQIEMRSSELSARRHLKRVEPISMVPGGFVTAKLSIASTNPALPFAISTI